MKSGIFSVLLALFLILPGVTLSAPLVDVEIAVGGWLNSPDGSAGYKGDDLNFEDDLNYDAETDLTGRARLELPFFLPNLTLMTTNLTYEETGKTASSFEFGGESFKSGENFDSKFKMDHHDIAVSFSFPFINLASLGKLQADLGLNLRIMDIEATIKQGNLRESKDLNIPIPMCYAYLRLEPFEGIAFEAEGRGIAFGDNTMTSIIGRARYNVFGPLFIAGGYRIESVDIDEEDVKIDADFKGPFFETGFKF